MSQVGRTMAASCNSGVVRWPAAAMTQDMLAFLRPLDENLQTNKA